MVGSEHGNDAFTETLLDNGARIRYRRERVAPLRFVDDVRREEIRHMQFEFLPISRAGDDEHILPVDEVEHAGNGAADERFAPADAEELLGEIHAPERPEPLALAACHDEDGALH